MAKRIIVADDSTTVQRVMKLILSPKGYEVESCDSGKKVMEVIKKGLPNIIFADAVMKNTNGLELATELKKRTPELANIPVVILVNSFDDIKDTDIKKSGAIAKLMKPFDDAQLLEAVDKYSLKVDYVDKTAISESTTEWNMESFEKPEIPDFNDPIKTVQRYGDKKPVDLKIDNDQPAQQVDDEFFTIPEDEIIKELGVPDPSEYKDVRAKSAVFPTSEETLSEEESQKLLEEFKLKENFDGTIKFDEDKTPVADFSSQAKKSPVERIEQEPDMGLWSGKSYNNQQKDEKTFDSLNNFDDLAMDLPDLEKELSAPIYNAVMGSQEIERATKEVVEKVVRELLPDIAEKVIREEISKIVGRE